MLGSMGCDGPEDGAAAELESAAGAAGVEVDPLGCDAAGEAGASAGGGGGGTRGLICCARADCAPASKNAPKTMAACRFMVCAV